MTYEFVANTLRESAGNDGMRFFPFVFSLFMFVLVANLWGMFPYFFTVTSHIIVTAALALIGHPDRALLRLLEERPAFPQAVRAERRAEGAAAVHHGDRGPLLHLAADQPVDPSFRQHACRPHHAEGVRRLRRALGSLGFIGVLGAVLPLLATVALTALEFLVAALQAYVFAILTSLYLNDALHPGH